MHFKPVFFSRSLACLLVSYSASVCAKANVCAIRRASELVLLARMYYATPAPPPVGDLGPEFESGLDLVLRKGEGSNDAHDFFKWASWRGMGDRTVRQALPRVLNKDITLPTHHA